MSKRPNAARLLVLLEQLAETLLNEECDNCGWTFATETLPPNVAGCTECAGVRAVLSEAIEAYRRDRHLAPAQPAEHPANCSVCGTRRVREKDGSLSACRNLECPEPGADYWREHPASGGEADRCAHGFKRTLIDKCPADSVTPAPGAGEQEEG